MQISEEQRLLLEIKKDPEKFSQVFDEYYAIIIRYIFRRTGEYELARDIASETFLKAFLHINQYNWKGISLLHWLYRIASNECALYFRKKKYSPQSLDVIISTGMLTSIDAQRTLEDKLQSEKELQQHQDFLEVQQKIKQLDVMYQEVLTLRYFEHISIKEIASILNKKEGTIKSLLSRAVEKLRKMF